jgi:serine/threonine protein kinase
VPWQTALMALVGRVSPPAERNSSTAHHPFRYPVAPLPVLLVQNNNTDDDVDKDDALFLDTGGLEISLLSDEQHFRRHIHRDDAERYAQERTALFTEMDDPKHEQFSDEWSQLFLEKENAQAEISPCQPLPWTHDSFPSCNIIHEIANLQRVNPDQYAVRQLGQGGTFRLGFLFANNRTQPTANSMNHHKNNHDAPYHPYVDDFVLKAIKIEYSSSAGREHLERVNEEALILAYLSHSDHVSNIYGYCGTSILVERGQDLYHQLIPHHTGTVDDDMRGYLPLDEMNKLHDQAENGLSIRNQFTAEQRLDIAISVMESIALLHGFPAGPVAHNDISFDQWLLSMDGKRVILNDFNSAVPLRYNAPEQKFCLHSSPSGNYKSPEYFHRPLFMNEQADVWALGCILFGILTGVMPYHEFFTDQEYMEQTRRGIPPVLNPAFRSDKASFIERRMVEIMDDMFNIIRAERSTIFDVVERLHETRDIHFAHKRQQRQLDYQPPPPPQQHRLLRQTTDRRDR